MINTAQPPSNSVYGREKLFLYDKINFSNHVCHYGAVVKEFLACADKPGSTPSDAAFSFFVLFFFSGLVYFFSHYFFFWPYFPYSYCRPCWSCTWINIYFKLKSGGLFWKRDTKTLDLRAYWPSLRPDKKHKLSRHVPPLKQVNFFSMSVDIMTQTHSTPQTVLIYSQHPQAKVKLAFCTAS